MLSFPLGSKRERVDRMCCFSPSNQNNGINLCSKIFNVIWAQLLKSAVQTADILSLSTPILYTNSGFFCSPLHPQKVQWARSMSGPYYAFSLPNPQNLLIKNFYQKINVLFLFLTQIFLSSYNVLFFSTHSNCKTNPWCIVSLHLLSPKSSNSSLESASQNHSKLVHAIFLRELDRVLFPSVRFQRHHQILIIRFLSVSLKWEA